MKTLGFAVVVYLHLLSLIYSEESPFIDPTIWKSPDPGFHIYALSLWDTKTLPMAKVYEEGLIEGEPEWLEEALNSDYLIYRCAALRILSFCDDLPYALRVYSDIIYSREGDSSLKIVSISMFRRIYPFLGSQERMRCLRLSSSA